ncbi:MAG: ABC transporter permease [Peptoniphilus sp.]|nr:ABC transporter permease [Peptoniphilus sp.]MDY6045385.1 ABC transporter permease [Peptoniphilus sp.]
MRLGPSKIRGKIEKTLAEDYFKSYKPTYRVIILSMVLSALVLTTVLVSQSYRGILNQYNTYHSPYNFSSAIYSEGALDGDMVNSLKNVEGIDQIHVYQSKDFKLFLGDNEGMLSPELKDAFDKGKKKSDDLYAKIYALSKRDFERLLKEHGAGGNPSYLLLNKISKDDDTPYAFREYIPITDDHPREIRLKYSAEGEPIDVDVGGYIDSMPYGLNAYDNHEIAIFTDVDHLNELFSTYGKEEASPYNEYTIAIRSKDDLEDVSKICEKIISAHYSKSDHFTDTEILNKASEKEQNRNEHVLNAGIQTILVIIALSNAYNSFQSNLRARRRDFQLLTTAGMTDAQTKTMILSEATMLFSRVLASYVAVFFIVIGLRSYRSPFPLRFVIKTLLLSINYLPILVIFAVMISGVLLAVQSGIKSVLEEDIHASL